MAAGHQKKRRNASNVVSSNLQERYRAKKKRALDSQHTVLNMRPHIHLKWDATEKEAVPKREQIGITFRDMDSFLDSIPGRHQGLADVFCIPNEIFDLYNLAQVLSYEVWETLLSESDQQLLTQFLPSGINVEQVLRPLLAGENLHFGNPFIHWGGVLCSGNLHPDVVVNRNHCINAARKAYYSELQQYHDDIIEKLQKWKEWWMSSKDPENDIGEKLWRCSGSSVNRSTPSEANESVQCGTEENLVATSDSGSWVVDDSSHSFDKVDSACDGGEKLSQRYQQIITLQRRKFGKLKDGNLIVVRQEDRVRNCKDVTRSRYGHSDAAAKLPSSKVKKISSKRPKHVSGGIHSGDSIETEPLKCGKESCSLQQDELLEEQQKNLHEHWLQLVNNHISVGFEHFRERKTRRDEWRISIDKELGQKFCSVEDGDETISDLSPLKVVDQDDEKIEPKASSDSSVDDRNECMSPSNSNCEQLNKIPSLNSHCELSTALHSEVIEGIVTEEAGAFSCSSYRENVDEPQVDVQPEVSGASEAVWSSVSMPESYYHLPSVSHGHGSCSSYYHLPSVSHGNGSCSELNIVDGAKSSMEPSHCLMELENSLLNQEGGGAFDEICGSALNMESGSSLLYPYSNQDQNGSLTSFLKGHNRIPQSYITHQIDSQIQPSIQCLPSSSVFSSINQFPDHYEVQHHERLQRQVMHDREKEVYPQQILQNTNFPNGQQARKDFFSPLDLQNWAPDSLRVNHAQSHANGPHIHGQNWYQPETRLRNWHGADASGPVQCMEGGVTAEGSLYGVISQCSQIDSRRSFGSSVSEPYAAGRNVSGVGVSRNGGIYSIPSLHQNNFLGRHDTSSMKLNTSLMNLAYPDANLPDSIGRPFLRTWNQ